MQPETAAGASAAFQEQLARAVRRADAAEIDGLAPERLAVYARLVRNNVHSFIRRCYPETARHCPPEQWAAAQEGFIADGRAHSPYFQDIPGEFLAYCRQVFRLPEHLLELMRFEHSQLLAETAPTPPDNSFEWDEDTLFRLSPAALLADYPFNPSAETPDFQADPATLLVWQDNEGSVYHSRLDPVDAVLLAAAATPLSQTQICSRLAAVAGTDNSQWQPEIARRWQQWVDADVLLPEPQA